VFVELNGYICTM